MEFYALNGAKKAGFPVRIAHAHNTHLPHGQKLPVKLVCKAMIPGAATDYFACGREAGIYYFGEKRWNESGVLIHNAIDLERFGYRSEVRTRLRRETKRCHKFQAVLPFLPWQPAAHLLLPAADGCSDIFF